MFESQFTVLLLPAIVAVLLFWPAAGVVPRLRAAGRVRERMWLEDALKHLHHCEYSDRVAGVESLAGALEVPRRRAVALLGALESAGLARSVERGVVLTAEGRSYALRVVRSHRLWERYLADRTGVEAEGWHAAAEKREHTLTEGEADALSASLGHPLFDPHGDPIPQSGGALPPESGVPLGMLEPGDIALIVHIEDEPPEVYRVLVRERLGPGTRVEMLPAPAGRVRFRAGGRERELDAVVASQVSVERLPAERVGEPDAGVETLVGVGPGESATVVRITAACQGPQRRRLLDLGVVPGTRVTARLRSAAGDPVAYDIRGALIALRREQAEWILVRPDSGGNGRDGGNEPVRL